MESFFYLFLAGILGGFIAGLVGIGGGVVYVFIIPIALKYLGVPFNEIPQYTIANSIFAILFASATANYVNIKGKNFFTKEVLILGSLGVAASILCLRYVVNTTWYSVLEFNIVLIILLLYMLYNTLISAKKVYVTPLTALKKWKLVLLGIAAGTISAFSGLGGGIIVIPVLNTLMKVDIRKASSISLGVITIFSVFMTLYNLMEVPKYDWDFDYAMGYIIFPIGIALSLGVIIGSPIGVKVAGKIESSTISYIYAFFLIIVILKKAFELYRVMYPNGLDIKY